MKVKSESKVAHSCRTLSDPMDCSLPGSSVHGIFQARVLEWGVTAFSVACTGETQKWKWKSLSHVRLLVTPWTIAHQVPLSMKFSRQEHWNESHSLLQRIFQGSNQVSCIADRFFTIWAYWRDSALRLKDVLFPVLLRPHMGHSSPFLAPPFKRKQPGR